MDENTLKRELDAFNHINDSHPKYLLTLDGFNANHNGIMQVNLVEWLLT